ncbi:MAG: hypothetical protein ABMB14_18055 [Myxococcota bacterium]
MSGWLLALIVGCSAPAESPATSATSDARPPVALRVTLDGQPKGGGGKLVVQAEYDPSGTISLPVPEVDGLAFTPDGPPTDEIVGDRAVVTQRYVFRGAKGAYEVPPLEVHWRDAEGPGGQPDRAPVDATSSAVFVDVDVPPPREKELADIVEPSPIRRLPWALIGIVGALFAAGLALAFRPRRAATVAVERPIPPDRAAIEAWNRVKVDPALTIHDKATEVARIFRVYVEAVLGFEATSRTTFELLEHLGRMANLPEGNVPRSKRILRAADRVRFAEERPAADWVDELDADLRAFVDSTKPFVPGPYPGPSNRGAR